MGEIMKCLTKITTKEFRIVQLYNLPAVSIRYE